MQVTKVKRHVDVPWEVVNTEDGYVVDRIVRNKDIHEETSYSILLQGYSLAEGTWEPFHQIPQHFNRGHWECQRRPKQQIPQVSTQN